MPLGQQQQQPLVAVAGASSSPTSKTFSATTIASTECLQAVEPHPIRIDSSSESLQSTHHTTLQRRQPPTAVARATRASAASTASYGRHKCHKSLCRNDSLPAVVTAPTRASAVPTASYGRHKSLCSADSLLRPSQAPQEPLQRRQPSSRRTSTNKSLCTVQQPPSRRHPQGKS
jgi:hypothetical protein